jgi:sterol desaturase/sphingolipid hydroxylase (fatty acid hydroxylase superfamily)
MSGLSTLGAILAAMAIVSLVEAVVPLRAGGAWARAHRRANVALTLVALATSLLLDTALVGALAWLELRGIGTLHWLAAPGPVTVALVVLGLDLAFYTAHVCMHVFPGLWRFHRVHHADPFVDVTTTVRQHPGETVIRYAFVGGAALALGASPAAYAVYRACAAANALLEHANVRVPARLDRTLALVTTWPSVHKVHHSRRAHETDTNYGNLFSVFDRLFGTFTPAARGADVPYGLDGLDGPAVQTAAGLLALPFRGDGPAPGRAP